MRLLPTLLVIAACALAGCATAPGPQTPAADPDARELSQHPLDVMNLPQP